MRNTVVSVLFGLSWICVIISSKANTFQRREDNLRLINWNSTWFTTERIRLTDEILPRRNLGENNDEFSRIQRLASYFRNKIENTDVSSRRVFDRESIMNRILLSNDRREDFNLRTERVMERIRRNFKLRNNGREIKFRKVLEHERDLKINSRVDGATSEKIGKNDQRRNFYRINTIYGEMFRYVEDYGLKMQSKIGEICRCTLSLIVGILLFEMFDNITQIKSKKHEKGFKKLLHDAVLVTGKILY